MCCPTHSLSSTEQSEGCWTLSFSTYLIVLWCFPWLIPFLRALEAASPVLPRSQSQLLVLFDFSFQGPQHRRLLMDWVLVSEIPVWASHMLSLGCVTGRFPGVLSLLALSSFYTNTEIPASAPVLGTVGWKQMVAMRWTSIVQPQVLPKQYLKAIVWCLSQIPKTGLCLGSGK